MEESKYIDLLLKRCLNFEKSKSLFINYDLVNKDFVDKVVSCAKKIGITDIYLDGKDIYKTHDILDKIDIENIEKDPYFNEQIWDEYAKKNASFLILTTEFPKVMDDIDPKKIAKATYIKTKTKPIYKEKQASNQIPWCIAALPNKIWALDLFPNEENSEKLLTDLIYSVCMVDKDDPINEWNNYLKKSIDIANKLNNLNIKKLHYKNSLGTDLTVTLPDEYIFVSAGSETSNMICNMPSYEVFATPDYRKTEGIVYSSKPLIHNGGLIDEFFIEFKEGKVSNYGAKKGYELLKEIIESDSNASFLGEVALVNYDSPISNTKVVFKTTLLDENASCHIALGDGFPECIKNGLNSSRKELLEKGINNSTTHVDFMIGTPDLNIAALTPNGEVSIFKDGNFDL
ncbi:MAG: aminopeptidase [Clostridium sp.]|nr:aminopeptidase [Clostridium sp.]MCM1444217.1 aminopeptidase [Candidatus Amulumruptor caecigallinarius]